MGSVGKLFKILCPYGSILSYPPCTIEHMLPPSLFTPVDLRDAVEQTRRSQGAHGVVDLLVVSLTDRRLRSDSEIDEHLDDLKAACRQTRRYREAIPVLERIAALNPDRKHEVAAELALVQTHLGERAKAVSALEAAASAQQQLPIAKRSLAFSLVAEVAALVLRQPELAQQCAALGRSTAFAPPAKAKRRTTAKAAAPAHLEQTAAPARATAPAPRRRKGLARPGLSAQPTLTDVLVEPEASARPLLTLIVGSAA